MFTRAEHNFGLVGTRCVNGCFGESVTPSKSHTSRLNFLEVGFVPEHRGLAEFVAQMRNHSVEEIFLQLPVFGAVARGDAEFFFEGDASRVCRPIIEWWISGLITSEMHIRCRENSGEFIENIKEELIGELRSWIEEVVGHTAGSAHIHFLVAHGELRIGVDGSHFVSWHFNFRNHHNVVLRCESHKLAHLVLGVKTRTGVLHIVHRWSLAAFGYKARICLDFNAPRLVVDEVKMDGIVFVARHFNDHSFKFCKGNERAHGIDHQFAHTSARSIHNFHRF